MVAVEQNVPFCSGINGTLSPRQPNSPSEMLSLTFYGHQWIVWLFACDLPAAVTGDIHLNGSSHAPFGSLFWFSSWSPASFPGRHKRLPLVQTHLQWKWNGFFIFAPQPKWCEERRREERGEETFICPSLGKRTIFFSINGQFSKSFHI